MRSDRGTMKDEFAETVVKAGDHDDLRAIVAETCRITGMGFAAIARVTEDRWITCQVLDQIELGLVAGDELDIKTTICDDIRAAGQAIVIDHVSVSETWRHHPTPAMYGFQSYASFPITLDDGSFYGTLCAIDPEPRRVEIDEVVRFFTDAAARAGVILSAQMRLAAEIAERAQLESDLREAVERSQFALVFQPQVALVGGRIVAAEALLRWHHPSGELRRPDSFIRRAEETGLIVEIGEWVIATVADTIARWEALGVEQRLAINVSRRQLDHASFFRKLREAMRAAGAPARLLELEITETMAMHFSGETLDAIAALRTDGATIAIDNFGTGYSNLGRLRDLPVDRVKLDRSLVEYVHQDEHARTVVQAVVGLIHGLGFEAVAEGIESEAQAEVLRILGCDVVQGYGVAPPMGEVAFLDWARGSASAARNISA